jgi:tRNA A-37 threonylcarbamoyl transferase component Bud32
VSQPLGSRYVLHEMLGRGAMGQVFRASVRDVETPVAVKLLKPELVSDPELVARFIQERSILTSVSHPNVVQIADLVVEGDTLGIVMEYVAGQDLRHHLRRQGTLAPAEAVGLTLQILHGVAAVHATGIVHRDIKPENLLLDTFGDHTVVKLTDFGVARLSYGTSLTKRTSLIGTPEYMSPELADGAAVTPSADLYSIGILLYEMLAGDTPFTGGHPLAVLRRHVEQPPAPLTGIPVELWNYIDWLLAKDPGSRPHSASEAAAALAALQPQLTGLAAMPRIPAPAPAAKAASYSRPDQPAFVTPPPGGRSLHSMPWGTGFEGRPMTAFPTGGGGGTVTRHRDRGYGPDEDSEVAAGRSGPSRARFVADPGRAAALAPDAGPQRSTADAPATGRSRLRRIGSRPMVLALPAAVVIVVAAIGVLLVRSHGSASAASSSTVSYAFPAGQYSDGLTIVRRWTLSGHDGSELTETVTASNAGTAAAQQPFEEVIPTTIASSLKTVIFSPALAKVVKTDPVVEWQLELPAGHRTVTVGYRATVPAKGLDVARLRQWAKDLTTQAAQLHVPLPTAIKVTSLTVSPKTVNLTGGKSTQLKLTGKLVSGSAVPAQILSGADWNTSNAAVVKVSSTGKVTAVGSGKATVTAQIGAIHASAAVTVVKSASNLAAGTGSNNPAVPSQPSQPGFEPSAPPSAGALGPGSNGGGNNGNSGSSGTKTTATSTASSGTTTTTYSETAGTEIPTWSEPTTGGGTAGDTLTKGETVDISCRLVGGDGNYWYRIASSPWDNLYYSGADNYFPGGMTSGRLTSPYDPKIPICSS